VNKLPFDHHLLLGMVAPRGLFAIDNIGFDWLGPFSSFGALMAARPIWTALGATTSMGFSQAANHSHCVFPSTQQTQLNAFINRFLLGQTTANTNITTTAGNYQFAIPNAQWAPWTPPALFSSGTGTTTVATTTPVGTTTTPVATTTPPASTPGTVAEFGQCGGTE
jgi:hypothetical protein